MVLTAEDLNNFTNIVRSIVDKTVHDAVSGLPTKADLDRMEGRLITSMNLLQRDTFSRLDEHDVRIQRLEKAAKFQ